MLRRSLFFKMLFLILQPGFLILFKTFGLLYIACLTILSRFNMRFSNVWQLEHCPVLTDPLSPAAGWKISPDRPINFYELKEGMLAGRSTSPHNPFYFDQLLVGIFALAAWVVRKDLSISLSTASAIGQDTFGLASSNFLSSFSSCISLAVFGSTTRATLNLPKL